ncbi:MAG: Calx-beta domain-containing protein, partial [Acidobacteriota bacterium]
MNDKIGSRACARLLPNRFGLLLSLTFFAASGLAAQQANGQVTPAPRAADSPRWQTASPETVSPWKTASDKVWTSKSAERYERRKDARGQRAGFEGRRSLEGRQGRGERRPVPLDAELIAKHADDCEWSDEFAQPGFDGPVFAIEMFDDGGGMALYAGGDFSSASGVAAESIAKWDGTTWAPLGLGILGDVYSMAVFDDGTGEALYVGGYFSVAGGVPAENIAKWDGTSWSALGLGTDDTVDALTVFDDGGGEDLYAGGYFNTAGGVAADYIAQWDGTTWSAVGLGTSGPVYDLLPFDDGGGTVLFAGGDFEFAGGVSVFGIAKWDGATWADLDEGVSGPVEALAVFDDGGGEDLYVGGFFAFAGPFPGVDVYGIARWDGIGWSDLDMGVDSIFEPPVVLSLAVFDDGGGEDLYVGGTFDIAGPAVLVSNIARWDGTAWSDVGLGTDSTVWALKAFDDGSGTDLFAGGEFFGAGTGPAPSLARWDGTAWSAVDSAGVTLAGLNGPVLALTTFDDGGGEDLYAGGFFIAAGSVPAIAVARWDGADWAALGSGLTCEIRGGPPGMLVAPAPADSDPATNKGIIIPEPCFPEVHAFAVYDDGSGPALYVAGVFDRAGGLPAANIAKWDGTTWSALGMGVEGRIEALAVYDDGSGAQLYAGGSFDTAGGAPADNIASWDGTTWSALGLGVDSDVEALGVFDGDLYAGGEFSTAGGAPANYIASWDGTTWSTLGTGTDDEVEAFGVFDDGTGAALYVGGNFSFAGGVLVDYIARWDGAAWSAVGGGLDDEVESFQVYDDGSGPALYAGGFFTIAGGVAASRIARWDGTDWEPLGLGIDDPFYAPSVETMTVWDKGDGPSLFAGGFFLLAGGMPSSFIAEWSCPVLDYGDAPDPTYPTLFASDGARHQVVSGFYLGSTADVELDGQLSADALGDDTTGTDDEDGVTFNNGLVPDASTAVDVVASAAGELDAWIDWNADGMWDAGEKIFDGEDLAAGTNSLSFSVPASATVGPTYARFRLSSAGVATPDGRAPDGEVEDYAVTISAPAEISISNVTLDEGDASMTAFAFVVSRSHNLSAASVDFATADGTASAGSDYAALALQTLSFTAGGSLSQMVTVQVTGDTTVEDDETFTVNLSSPVAATVSDGTGIGTIDNDDSTELSISSQDQAEAAGAMTFTVSLSNPVDVAISVDVSTTDGTATTGDSDYAGLSGQTVNLAANTTSAMFDVTVNDDSTVEADETFTTSLSNLVAGGRDVTLASGGTGTIENDDSAELSLSSVS